MRLQHPLAVVTPTLDGSVLTALARVDAGFTAGELGRLMPDRSVAGLRKVLVRLTGQGVVDEERLGRVARYRLNRDHLAAGPIIALAEQRTELLRRTGDVLASWAAPPVYAALFGSAARGDMDFDSDIDLFVVRPLTEEDDERWEGQLGDLASRVTRWTGNDTRVLEMTEAEVRHGAQHRDPVLGSVVAEGLALAGDLAWMRRLWNRAPGAMT